MIKRVVIGAVLASMAASGSMADQTPPQAQLAPPPHRERPAAATEEGGLWQASDNVERDAQRSGERLHAPELERYVREIACGVAQNYCGDIRVYLMQRPFFNAAMAPNGYMEVWSGLLLRADDEAQLSFVLGHEVTHYTERHTLQRAKQMRDSANGAMLVSFALAAAGTAAAVNNPGSARSIMDSTGSLIDVVYLGSVAAVFNFSRENESEADSGGYQRAVAAGYSPQSGALLWKTLNEEKAQSDFPKARAREARASIFSTHPLSADRVAALEKMSAGAPPGNESRTRYRAAIRPHLGAWLRDDLRRRDYGETLYTINRLSKGGEDPGVLNFYRGEAYRLRRKDGDVVLARQAYEIAMKYPDAPPETWRQLADILEREGKKSEARDHYAAYLAKAPDAQDKLLIQARLGGNSGQSIQNPNADGAAAGGAAEQSAPPPVPAPAVTSLAQ